jgi:hypothetical protein
MALIRYRKGVRRDKEKFQLILPVIIRYDNTTI